MRQALAISFIVLVVLGGGSVLAAEMRGGPPAARSRGRVQLVQLGQLGQLGRDHAGIERQVHALQLKGGRLW